MKKYKFHLLAVCFTILFSCTENKEKYYGEWNLIHDNNFFNYGYDIDKLIISKDSIHFRPVSIYNHKISYPLTIENNKFYFNDTLFEVSLKYDSILNFNSLKYTNYPNSNYTIEEYKNTVNIKYSDKNHFKKLKVKNIESILCYGKKNNSRDYALLLDGENTNCDDLILLAFGIGSHSYFPEIFLLADKDSKMKEISKILLSVRHFNSIKLSFISNHNLHINDSLRLRFMFEGITRKLTFISPEEITSLNLKNISFIPHPEGFTLKKLISSNTYIVSLVNNKFYFGLKEVSKEELVSILKEKMIVEQPTFLTLFDDISVYSNYLELLHSFDTAYYSLRNKKSKETFKTGFNNLNQKERRKIFEFIPRKTFDGISYSQFKKLNIKIPELKLIE